MVDENHQQAELLQMAQAETHLRKLVVQAILKYYIFEQLSAEYILEVMTFFAMVKGTPNNVE